MYKLYTDKQETFECDLFLEGADLKQSSARIVVESKDLTLMFKGTIDDKGNCKVPIKKLKGLKEEILQLMLPLKQLIQVIMAEHIQTFLLG